LKWRGISKGNAENIEMAEGLAGDVEMAGLFGPFSTTLSFRQALNR